MSSYWVVIANNRGNISPGTRCLGLYATKNEAIKVISGDIFEAYKRLKAYNDDFKQPNKIKPLWNEFHTVIESQLNNKNKYQSWLGNYIIYETKVILH